LAKEKEAIRRKQKEKIIEDFMTVYFGGLTNQRCIRNRVFSKHNRQTPTVRRHVLIKCYKILEIVENHILMPVRIVGGIIASIGREKR
jgi:hypothetical protein